jgi:hypothetical protein
VLLAPVGVLALLSLFVPGSRRAIPSMSVALLGFVTAVAVAHVSVSHLGAATVPVWPGPALSLFWLGLVGGVVVALDALRKASVPLAIVASAAVAGLMIPMLGAFYFGTSQVQPASTRILPAVVTVAVESHPSIGTLVITPEPDGAIGVDVQRGDGTTLDDQSTLHATSSRLTTLDSRLAKLSGNLASRSGYDAKTDLSELGIGFVVLAPSSGDDGVHQRIAEALDSNSLLDPVGQTDNGLLWRYTAIDVAHLPAQPAAITPIGTTVLIVQAIVFVLTLLLGIPTSRRRRRSAIGAERRGAPTTEPGEPLTGEPLAVPATTFDRQDDDA